MIYADQLNSDAAIFDEVVSQINFSQTNNSAFTLKQLRPPKIRQVIGDERIKLFLYSRHSRGDQ